MEGEGAKGVIVEVARVSDAEGARARARAAQGDSAAQVTVSETAEDRAKGATGRIHQHGRPALIIRNGGDRTAVGAIRTGRRSRYSGCTSACPTSKTSATQ